jgi:hypothetical protein
MNKYVAFFLRGQLSVDFVTAEKIAGIVLQLTKCGIFPLNFIRRTELSATTKLSAKNETPPCK